MMGSRAAWDTIQLTRKHSGQGKSVVHTSDGVWGAATLHLNGTQANTEASCGVDADARSIVRSERQIRVWEERGVPDLLGYKRWREKFKRRPRRYSFCD